MTIIIPIYARTIGDLEFLDRCVGSCVGQAPVVVWNDGSAVDLGKVARKYPSVTFGGAAHRGKSFARNHAADLAQTPLILPVDADDWLAPGTVARMRREWRGVPLYTWVFKWYNEHRVVEHHCQEFSCSIILWECISSINVLHSKEQWAMVGGWDERLNLFEDWLYNSKLMWLFCGQLIPKPLFYYRQHAGQSTKAYRSIEGRTRQFVRAELAKFAKENEGMARTCCGKRRRNETPDLAAARTRGAPTRRSFTPTTPSTPPPNPDRYGARSALPAENSGRIVKARYIGNKGAGPHYYRDPDTRHAYKVRYGVHVQADIVDTCSQEDHDKGNSRKLLIRVESLPPIIPPEPPPLPPPPPEIVEPQPAPPVSGPKPIPSMEELLVHDLQPMPTTVRELRELVMAGQSRGQLVAWLDYERSEEKPRITAVKLLEKALNG